MARCSQSWWRSPAAHELVHSAPLSAVTRQSLRSVREVIVALPEKIDRLPNNGETDSLVAREGATGSVGGDAGA